MKNSARHAQEEDERLEQAVAERNYVGAGSALMRGLYKRMLGLLETEEYEIAWGEEQAPGYDMLFNLLTALDAQIEREGDAAPARLLLAREAISALAETQAMVEGRDAEAAADEGVRTAKLVLCACRIGQADLIARLYENGLWDEFGAAKSKLFNMGSGQRGRQANWETAFAPRAQAYCAGKAKVSLGQLCALARTWGEEERRAGRNPGLPGSDDGIRAGLKRMEERELLAIPGRAPST